MNAGIMLSEDFKDPVVRKDWTCLVYFKKFVVILTAESAVFLSGLVSQTTQAASREIIIKYKQVSQ